MAYKSGGSGKYMVKSKPPKKKKKKKK